ncbi:manganese catalase family protein [Halegenticoccus tardaugens]|uniref:manganese catalase family protein n=1 Tax=Halegenticoccus tardaugens TaxID=2071624 RepID=UPI00100AFBFD|nr:manganese catalase family protein [Halegenticoccus tardaugens]
MFYHENKLQYDVEVEDPNPVFAKMLQQAIGGVEGEMRVAMQYLFQAWALPPEHEKYRRMLLNTGAEELGHIEMLATAVAKNLEGAPLELKGEMTQAVGAGTMNGIQPRQVLSSGLHAMAVDSDGVPFNGNYVVASGNLAADMTANVMAESTGRLLATRLWEMTDDPGMKDMLSYLIARDTMHQNQWLTVLQDLGETDDPFEVFPIPDSFPDAEENEEFNYAFMTTDVDGGSDSDAPWTQGTSMDGEGRFSHVRQRDLAGGDPDIGAPDPRTHDDPTPRGED